MNKLKIGNDEVILKWSNETARRFRYRLGLIGGHPSHREITDPKTAESAYTRILWALLPSDVFAKYETPEDLFTVLTDKDVLPVANAISAIYEEMNLTDQKKSTPKKRPSRKSS